MHLYIKKGSSYPFYEFKRQLRKKIMMLVMIQQHRYDIAAHGNFCQENKP